METFTLLDSLLVKYHIIRQKLVNGSSILMILDYCEESAVPTLLCEL